MTQEQIAKHKKKVEMDLGEYEENIDNLWSSDLIIAHSSAILPSATFWMIAMVERYKCYALSNPFYSDYFGKAWINILLRVAVYANC